MRPTSIVAVAMLSAGLACAQPTDLWCTNTIPASGGGTATAQTMPFSGTLLEVQFLLQSTADAATSTVALAKSAASAPQGSIPGESIVTLSSTTTTNQTLRPFAITGTNILYTFVSQRAVFTLTGGNSNTVTFIGRVTYEPGPR